MPLRRSLVSKWSQSVLKRILPKNSWGDTLFALLEYRRRQGRFPRTNGGQYFSDQIYRLKVSGELQDPLRIFVTDKEYVKYYIAGVVGQQYTIETYQVLRNKTDIGRLQLKRFPCVVKPTHLSGSVELHVDCTKPVCHDTLEKWLEVDYYLKTREQNYRGLRPKVIVEEFISEDGCLIPEDYKFFCFRGVPKLIQVDSNRFADHTRSLYDTNWIRLPMTLEYPDTPHTHPKPAALETMLDVATRLSRPFSFVRVDMYTAKGLVKVGELTSCPGSAGEQIHPPSGEAVLGQLFEPC